MVTRPDAVERIHRSFFEVGATWSRPTPSAHSPRSWRSTVRPTGSASSIWLRPRWPGARPTTSRPRTVPGGWRGASDPAPSSRPSGQIRYADLRDAYEEQAVALIEGDVDLIIIETVFDLLQAKAAINGARRAMRAAGRHLPIQTQVTIELTGTMLPGTEIGAALRALEAMGVDLIGLNCATGPAEMFEPLRHLTGHSQLPITCLPNAGLPSVVDGAMHYDLTPEQLAEFHRQFVSELGSR